MQTHPRPKLALTYRITGSGVGSDGWWKYHAIRSDGRQVRITRKRYADLNRAGRIEGTSSP